MVIATKGIDYDYHTDSIYTVPECPKCHSPLFMLGPEDIGNPARCVICGAEVMIPDEPWIKEYIENNTGSREVKTTCMMCGAEMTAIQYKCNGEWRTGRGSCNRCGMRFIV